MISIPSSLVKTIAFYAKQTRHKNVPKIMLFVTLSAVSILIGIFHIGKFCFWVPFLKSCSSETMWWILLKFATFVPERRLLKLLRGQLILIRCAIVIVIWILASLFWNTVYLRFIKFPTTLVSGLRTPLPPRENLGSRRFRKFPTLLVERPPTPPSPRRSHRIYAFREIPYHFGFGVADPAPWIWSLYE